MSTVSTARPVPPIPSSDNPPPSAPPTVPMQSYLQWLKGDYLDGLGHTLRRGGGIPTVCFAWIGAIGGPAGFLGSPVVYHALRVQFNDRCPPKLATTLPPIPTSIFRTRRSGYYGANALLLAAGVTLCTIRNQRGPSGWSYSGW